MESVSLMYFHYQNKSYKTKKAADATDHPMVKP